MYRVAVSSAAVAVLLACAAIAFRLSRSPAPSEARGTQAGAGPGTQFPGASGPPPTQVAPIDDLPPVQIKPSDLARADEERDDNVLKMKFCFCPPGTFRMGNTPGVRWQLSDAAPVRTTISRGFWMGKHRGDAGGLAHGNGGDAARAAGQGPGPAAARR